MSDENPLTGRTGQVRRELHRPMSTFGELIALDRRALDLTSSDSIRKALREARPNLIVNAAAYTAVDQAEFENARLHAGPAPLRLEASRLKSIPAAEYPSPAVRPANSVMSNKKLLTEFGIALPSWESSLAMCMEDMAG